MPDFESFHLGAPVRTEIEYRGAHKHVKVDGRFEIVAPSLAKADTTLVATMNHNGKRLVFFHGIGTPLRG